MGGEITVQNLEFQNLQQLKAARQTQYAKSGIGTTSDIDNPFFAIFENMLNQENSTFIMSGNGQNEGGDGFFQVETDMSFDPELFKKIADKIQAETGILPTDALNMLYSIAQIQNQFPIMNQNNLGESVTDISSLADKTANEILASMYQLKEIADSAQPEQSQKFVLPIIEAKYTETLKQPEVTTGISVPNLISRKVIHNDSVQEALNFNPREKVKAEMNIFAENTTRQTDKTWQVEKKAVSMSREPTLLEQLKTGIKDNLMVDKKEFVIKLKPAELGEITVKLVQKAGKTVLDIATVSSHTAKLLNNELAALKEAVKPYDVEVHEVVHQSTQPTQNTSEQFDMAGQQFADQQKAFYERQQQRHNSSSEDMLFAEEVDDETDVITAADGLDKYV